ncbi:uncharacterized protein BYT42DRAFT_340581 [Radiomyces spectabilis]|uniref:uncharacterized protein n=1 Tax=Radiomyces spectabilis TaxID=64574 RepID=UPI002220A939|nr:uncharacterized protein BYT42DRAFT_340581 [Radiomyces spectabilis]KAI8379784.1 hypothetical protein BYT42DRAFT_340581 [Radiomyces spectabilis]
MLESMSAPALIEGMRALVAESQDLEALFGDFFFDTWCMGIKAPFRDSLTDSTGIWSIQIPRTLMWVQKSCRFLTNFWSVYRQTAPMKSLLTSCSVPWVRLLISTDTISFRIWRGVGGFALYLKSGIPTNDFWAVYAQAYSKVKVPFYKFAASKDRSGIAVSPSQIFSNSFPGLKPL